MARQLGTQQPHSEPHVNVTWKFGLASFLSKSFVQCLLVVRRGLPLSPSDSQRTFDPERYHGPLKTSTNNNNNNNETDHYKM
eukprot:15622028-Heterocapsa_arctica.AAC.1